MPSRCRRARRDGNDAAGSVIQVEAAQMGATSCVTFQVAAAGSGRLCVGLTLYDAANGAAAWARLTLRIAATSCVTL